MGENEIEYVSLEQALRWIAYKLPPLSDRLEKIKEYPNVLEWNGPDISGGVVFAESQDVEEWGYSVTSSCKEAAKLLLLALAEGELVARGLCIENETGPDFERFESGFKRGKYVPISSSDWNVNINWREPSFIDFDYGDTLGAWIKFDELKVMFPESKTNYTDSKYWVSLSEAVDWVAFGETNSSKNDFVKSNKVWTDVKRAIANGLVPVEGICNFGNADAFSLIPETEWFMENVDYLNNSTPNFYAIRVDFEYLKFVFDQPDKNVVLEKTKSKAGRKPKVPREVWLEALALLFMDGVLVKGDSNTTVIQSLKNVLEKQGYGVSEDTIRKDYLKSLFDKSTGWGN